MASQGPNSPSTASNITDANVAWTNPGNVTTADGNNATVVLNNAQVSQFLRATDFGFTIPTGATIDGIVIEILGAGTSRDAIKTNNIQLVSGGSVYGTAKTPANSWPQTAVYMSFGSSSDTWGATPTPAIINASTFGFQFRVDCTTLSIDETAAADHVRITIHFTTSFNVAWAVQSSQVIY